MNNYGSVPTTKEAVSNNIEEGRTDAEIDESSALIGDKDGDMCIKRLQYVDRFREEDKILWYQNLFNYLRDCMQTDRSSKKSPDSVSKVWAKNRTMLFMILIVLVAFMLSIVFVSKSDDFTKETGVTNTTDARNAEETTASGKDSAKKSVVKPINASSPTGVYKWVSRSSDPLDNIIDTTMFENIERIKPFPTGAFWTNLVMKPSSAEKSQSQNPTISYPIAAEPYAFKWGQQEGLQISYPSSHRVVTPLEINDQFIPDISITSSEAVRKRQIINHDLMSVTLRFNTDPLLTQNSQGESSTSHFDVYVVQGSPYVTAKFENSTPNITPLSIYSSFGIPGEGALRSTNDLCIERIDNGNPWSVTLTSDKFLLQQPEGDTWLLTFSLPVTLSLDCASKRMLTTVGSISGVVRLALIPQGARPDGVTVDTLLNYSTVYPTGVQVKYHGKEKTEYTPEKSEVVTDTAIVTFSYDTDGVDISGNASLLMLALPHLAPLLSDQVLSTEDFEGEYLCIKGHMKPIVGKSWVFTETLTNISFTNGVEISSNRTKFLLAESLSTDVDLITPQARNSYGFGKQAARMAQLALIADEILEHEIRDKALNILKNHSLPWFLGTNDDKIVYDTDFGGLVTSDGLSDTMADFGNGRYNDHHFHYGYFIYAAAVLGKLDPDFVTQYGSAVDALVADVANYDADSSFFPVSRYKSWYDGHSWASGLFSQGNGKNQESSSEAINCYYASYLWSLVRGDLVMNVFSRLLLATEIRATKMYYHTGPSSSIYDETFAKNYMVGNLGGIDVNSRTWFGSEAYYVHGIQMIPITAITEDLFDRDYVEGEYENVISHIYETIDMHWKGFFVCDHAIIDYGEAWKQARSLESGQLDEGLSLSQIYYWIATRSSDSEPDIEVPVTKDGVDYSQSCFLNSGCKHLNLNGDCCPTPYGDYLGCCARDTAVPPDQSKEVSESEKSCDSNPSCALLKLEGDCCPTPGGVFLGCCSR